VGEGGEKKTGGKCLGKRGKKGRRDLGPKSLLATSSDISYCKETERKKERKRKRQRIVVQSKSKKEREKRTRGRVLVKNIKGEENHNFSTLGQMTFSIKKRVAFSDTSRRRERDEQKRIFLAEVAGKKTAMRGDGVLRG